MYNLYTHIATEFGHCQKLTFKDTLVTVFNCGLSDKYSDLWSHHNYVVYVVEGRKIWHTSAGSYDLRKGSCVFVQKGAAIVEQFFDTEFCLFLFFMPDDFIQDVLKSKTRPVSQMIAATEPVMKVHNDATINAYFQSMLPYFEKEAAPDPSLLELKFKELVLAIADNRHNPEIHSYFCSLLNAPQIISIQRVMEENFCFNLKLEEFARLCSRSLSAFKRDFEKIYAMSPGKWLMEKRLKHSLHLLTNMGKTVSEAAFESGFENSSHFSRAFRQRFGYSPATIRQQLALT